MRISLSGALLGFFILSLPVFAGVDSTLYSFIPMSWGFFASVTTADGGTEPYLINKSGELIPIGDLNPGAASSAPDGYRFNDIVLFNVTTPQYGRELWRTNGTLEGTYLLKDFVPGPADGGGSFFETLNGHAYFLAGAGSTRTLWITDGTPAGTHQLLAGIPGVNGEFAYPKAFGGLVYFNGDTAGAIWRTDGTPEGTKLFYDFKAPASIFAIAGTQLYFDVVDYSPITEHLWVTDGTVASVKEVDQFHSYPQSDFMRKLGALNNQLLFFPPDRQHMDYDLWRTDGTPQGTVSLKPRGIMSNYWYAATTTLAFFTNQTTQAGNELWKTDGTPSGSRMVVDLIPGPTGSYPTNLTELNGRVYFSIVVPANGQPVPGQLWVTDGTAPGTKVFKEFAPTDLSSSVKDLQRFGPLMYFKVQDREIWTTDGTGEGTVKVFGL